MSCSDGSTRVTSYIEFDEAYHLFLSYSTNGHTGVKDSNKKKHCVQIITINEKQFVVLRSDDVDLKDFFLHISESATGMSRDGFVLNKENVQALYHALDTERDKKILRVILGATTSRAELDALGIDSDSLCKDKQCVFGYLEQLEDIENEANSKVAEKIDKQIEKKESLLSSKKRLLSSKDGLWSKPQIEEERESVKDLNNVINSLKTLKDEKESVSK